jgi:hypothetical protein
MLSLRRASESEDLREATDWVAETDRGTIAVRIRRLYYWTEYRDLTIRAWRRGNKRTELEKIKGGWARWYLYAWSDGKGDLWDWIFVDLDKLRASGLLDNEEFIKNPDCRTAFLPLPDVVLKSHGCIVNEKPDLYQISSTGRYGLYFGLKTFEPVEGSKLKPVTVHLMRYADNGELSTFTDIQFRELWTKIERMSTQDESVPVATVLAA